MNISGKLINIRKNGLISSMNLNPQTNLHRRKLCRVMFLTSDLTMNTKPIRNLTLKSWFLKDMQTNTKIFRINRMKTVILDIARRICYNMPRQRCNEQSVRATNTPEVASSGVFYSVLARWLKPQAGCLLFVSVQPFADEVANHTCHNRDNKGCNEYFRKSTPLSVPVQGWQHSHYILSILYVQLHIKRYTKALFLSFCYQIVITKIAQPLIN